MKGHLQRLAASAARPAQSVRPLVRGFFTQDIGAAQETLEETSEVRTPRHVEPRTERQYVQERKLVERQPEVMPEEARASNQKKAEALIPERPVERLVVQQDRSDDETSIHKIESSRQDAARVIPATGIEPMRALEVRPLLVEQPEPEDAPDSVTTVAAEHRSADTGVIQPRIESANRERDRGEGSRTSNEVQIHIGRIEVIAVPPPAPQRAAAATERRGESLDDYLRRKDRRAR